MQTTLASKPSTESEYQSRNDFTFSRDSAKTVIDTHERALRHELRQMRFVGESADEILQRTWVKVFCSSHPVSCDSDKVEAYLRGAVRHVATDYIRQRERQPTVSDEILNYYPRVERPTPSLQLIEECRLLAKAIDELPPKQRQALVLHDYENLSFAEAAEEMKIKEPTARWHAREARRSLAHKLGQTVEAHPQKAKHDRRLAQMKEEVATQTKEKTIRKHREPRPKDLSQLRFSIRRGWRTAF